MKHTRLPLAETGQFSPIFLDYINQEAALTDFYGLPPKLENFRKQIDLKSAGFSLEYRKVLVKAFEGQYGNINLTTREKANINALQEANTFTVTTGHQLNIFSGPLYFIYKILTAVKACEQLRKAYPEHQFVPVYWMASEDHDLAEIQHFNLFGKKYTWETDQQGAVGRMAPNGLAQLAQDLPEPAPLFEKAYAEESTLANATRRFVHELYGHYGVLTLDADSPELKKLFIPVLQEELLEQSSEPLVKQQSARLDELNYKSQVFPRPINLFYLKDNIRERIEQVDNSWQVLNTDISFSEEELKKELENHPERFSPNVVLRPLYQEWILPNLAYVGGPGEFAYWLQLKPFFDHYQVPFPILLPRQFAIILAKVQESRREKLNLSMADLFKDSHELKLRIVKENSDNELSLASDKEALAKAYQIILDKALAIDGSLKGFIGAEESKAQKGLDNIEKRLKKAEEQKHETELKQLESLLAKLFPNGSLQERSDNFLNFYLNDPKFIERLHGVFDAFALEFNVLAYTDDDQG
jgi:bacillithiol biosynthesis cysteine-adding enzyme BshC